jgi:hypothetical protein
MNPQLMSLVANQPLIILSGSRTFTHPPSNSSVMCVIALSSPVPDVACSQRHALKQVRFLAAESWLDAEKLRSNTTDPIILLSGLELQEQRWCMM